MSIVDFCMTPKYLLGEGHLYQYSKNSFITYFVITSQRDVQFTCFVAYFLGLASGSTAQVTNSRPESSWRGVIPHVRRKIHIYLVDTPKWPLFCQYLCNQPSNRHSLNATIVFVSMRTTLAKQVSLPETRHIVRFQRYVTSIEKCSR